MLSSPTHRAGGRCAYSKSGTEDATAFQWSASKETVTFDTTQGDVRQSARGSVARRTSQVSFNIPGDGAHPITFSEALKVYNKIPHGDFSSQPPKDPERAALSFSDWLGVVEKEQGADTKTQFSQLSLWCRQEALIAQTPFAAVVMCPRLFETEEELQGVSAVIDAFALRTFYVQTLPMVAKLSDVAQVFLESPSHLPVRLRGSVGHRRGIYAHTTVPCHGGRDAIKLLKRSAALQEAVRDTQCLLLNDHCPITTLCLHCFVVAGCCVAAEAVCDEAYAAIFGVRPNNQDVAMGSDDIGDDSDSHVTVDKPNDPLGALSGEKRGDPFAHRTATEVVACGMKTYVEHVVGRVVGKRSYTALLTAEVRGFDPRVLRSRGVGQPHWPAMRPTLLHLRPSPFQETDLRFRLLSLGCADSSSFEAFGLQELRHIGDDVVQRTRSGMRVPPVLRFLDGRGADRVEQLSPTPPILSMSSRLENGATPNPRTLGNDKSSPSKTDKATFESSTTTSNPLATSMILHVHAASSLPQSHHQFPDEGTRLRSSYSEGETSKGAHTRPRSSLLLVSSLPSAITSVRQSTMASDKGDTWVSRSVDDTQKRRPLGKPCPSPAQVLSSTPWNSTSEDRNTHSLMTDQSGKDRAREISPPSFCECGSVHHPVQDLHFNRSAFLTTTMTSTRAERVQRLPSRRGATPFTSSLLSVPEVSRCKMSSASSTQDSSSVDRPHSDGISALSSNSSRLPERRRSNATSNLSEHRLYIVTSSGSPRLRSSLLPRRRLSLAGATSVGEAPCAASGHVAALSVGTS